MFARMGRYLIAAKERITKLIESDNGPVRGLPPSRLCPSGVGLVVFDLDGTVLEYGVGPSRRTLDAFDAAHALGCEFAVASGRPVAMIPEPVRKASSVGYLITTNGARTLEAGSGRVIDARGMTPEMVSSLVSQVADLDPAWNAFVDGRGYFEWRCLSYMLARERRTPKRALRRLTKAIFKSNVGTEQIHSINELIDRGEPIEKVGCTFPSPEASEQAMDSLQARGDLEVARMGEKELEVTASGVTKGSAVAALASYLGIPRQRVVAFGDAGNDLPMKEHVGCFVAMGNATDEVKGMSDDVTASVSDDGVAAWIESHSGGADD